MAKYVHTRGMTDKGLTFTVYLSDLLKFEL